MAEFTDLDKELAKGIDKKYVWMVRVKSGALYATEAKPCKVGAKIWFVDDVDGGRRLLNSAALASKLFKPIKWRDKEPTRISDIYGSNSQPVLTSSERQYLKMVLKPFHDEVEYVAKYGHNLNSDGTHNDEYLQIVLHDGNLPFPESGAGETLTFSHVDAGKMYAGMELRKRYKLDELGITYAEGKS